MQPGQPLPLPSGMLKKHLCPSALTISTREHSICKAKLPSWTHSFSRKKTAGKQQIDSSPKPSVLAKACISPRQFSHPTIKDHRNMKYSHITADSFHFLPTNSSGFFPVH